MDLPDELKKVLKKVYYDPSNVGSFGSVQNLYTEAKKEYLDLSLKDVKLWLSSQRTYTLHKVARRKFKRNKVIVTRKDEEWMCDLSDMNRLKNSNDGYNQMLTVIDCFSKYAWIIPIKDKRATTIKNAFEIIFKTQNETNTDNTETRIPEKLHSDKGGEFNNAIIKKMCNDMGIRYFTSQNEETKASIVGRFNRTIKHKLFKYFRYHPNSERWIDIYKIFLKT